ncbi:MAG: prepilin peptidase [Acidobacteria bacterium]|nr:prepilin peptidase [Acidobacteriota bacterium]
MLTVGQGLEITRDVLLYGVVTVCAITDILYGKIYNKITYPVIMLGVLLSLFAGFMALKSSLVGLLVGFILYFLVFMMGGFGGGDVKLMTAVGALMGYPFVLYASFYSALIGGIMSIAAVVWKGKFLRTLRNVFSVFFSYPLSLLFPGMEPISLNPENSIRIPFGFAICLGTLWAVLEFHFQVSVFDLINKSRLVP